MGTLKGSVVFTAVAVAIKPLHAAQAPALRVATGEDTELFIMIFFIPRPLVPSPWGADLETHLTQEAL